MNIIILDDSLTIRMIIESFLEELGVSDDEMHMFENGHQALDFIKEYGADIVLSDINMPCMSGFEFAEALFESTPELKRTFFAISGEERRDSYAQMKSIGVRHFIKKPIQMEYFKHFIEPEIVKKRAKTL